MKTYKPQYFKETELFEGYWIIQDDQYNEYEDEFGEKYMFESREDAQNFIKNLKY